MDHPPDLSFPLLRLRLDAGGLSPKLAAWLREYWAFDIDLREDRGGVLRLNPAEPPNAEALDKLCWTAHASVPGVALPCAHQDGTVWIGSASAGARLAPRLPDMRLDIWHAASGDATVHAALFVALAEAVRWTGLVPLHAAVVARDGNATALLGRSGTGKSTTLLRAAELGWTVLSEDFAWLDPVSLDVHGWDRGVHVWPETLEGVVPQFAGLPWTPVSDGKLFLPFHHLTGQRATSARLTRVVSLVRDDGPAGWSPLSAGDAVRALWECTGVPLADAARAANAAVISHLLRTVEIRTLRIGPQPLLL
jgi:hypothetical protein